MFCLDAFSSTPSTNSRRISKPSSSSGSPISTSANQSAVPLIKQSKKSSEISMEDFIGGSRGKYKNLNISDELLARILGSGGELFSKEWIDKLHKLDDCLTCWQGQNKMRSQCLSNGHKLEEQRRKCESLEIDIKEQCNALRKSNRKMADLLISGCDTLRVLLVALDQPNNKYNSLEEDSDRMEMVRERRAQTTTTQVNSKNTTSMISRYVQVMTPALHGLILLCN